MWGQVMVLAYMVCRWILRVVRLLASPQGSGGLGLPGPLAGVRQEGGHLVAEGESGSSHLSVKE